jgi:redox-sensitive bicupin YhaK (pirin superfamily)
MAGIIRFHCLKASPIIGFILERLGQGFGTHSHRDMEIISVHFLQIWIEPGVRGIAPSYELARATR